jgi:hypothetical protein
MSIRWMYATERRSIALKGFAFMLILAVPPFPTENFGAQRGVCCHGQELAFC